MRFFSGIQITCQVIKLDGGNSRKNLQMLFAKIDPFTAWWLNQPIWKNMLVKMGSSSPIFGVKIKKYVKFHHLDSTRRTIWLREDFREDSVAVDFKPLISA